MVQPLTHVKTMDLIALETSSTLAVGTTDTAYTQSFQWPQASNWSMEYGLTSSGTMDVKVEVEVGTAAPATEGAASTSYDQVTTLAANLADANLHFDAPNPPVAVMGRLKLTGQGSNDASTVLSTLKLHYTSTHAG